MAQDLLRLPSAIQRLGYGRASIYAAVSRGELPPPVRIGTRAVAWPSGEIDQLIRARVRGATVAEIKALVVRLVAARSATAQDDAGRSASDSMQDQSGGLEQPRSRG